MDDTTLIAKCKEELKSLLMRVKEKSKRAGLKLNIQKKSKIMASGPIISWHIEGKRASLMAQMAKCLPTMQETWVQILHQEDPLEKEMTAHSSIIDWRNPWTKEPDRL